VYRLCWAIAPAWKAETGCRSVCLRGETSSLGLLKPWISLWIWPPGLGERPGLGHGCPAVLEHKGETLSLIGLGARGPEADFQRKSRIPAATAVSVEVKRAFELSFVQQAHRGKPFDGLLVVVLAAAVGVVRACGLLQARVTAVTSSSDGQGQARAPARAKGFKNPGSCQGRGSRRQATGLLRFAPCHGWPGAQRPGGPKPKPLPIRQGRRGDGSGRLKALTGLFGRPAVAPTGENLGHQSSSRIFSIRRLNKPRPLI